MMEGKFNLPSPVRHLWIQCSYMPIMWVLQCSSTHRKGSAPTGKADQKMCVCVFKYCVTNTKVWHSFVVSLMAAYRKDPLENFK